MHKCICMYVHIFRNITFSVIYACFHICYRTKHKFPFAACGGSYRDPQLEVKIQRISSHEVPRSNSNISPKAETLLRQNTLKDHKSHRARAFSVPWCLFVITRNLTPMKSQHYDYMSKISIITIYWLICPKRWGIFQSFTSRGRVVSHQQLLGKRESTFSRETAQRVIKS